MENHHSEHRDRMRTKYERFGESVFETHQLLEMMLFSLICRKDTNVTSHDLLEKTGGDFFSASLSDMCCANGVGSSVASGVKLSCEAVRRLICDNISSGGLDSEFKRKMYLYLRMMGKPYESVFALTLTAKGKKTLDFSDVTLKVRDPGALAEFLIKNAEENGGKEVVLCHSHGNGAPAPSVEDIYLTALLRKKLEGSGICLSGSYIVAGNDCVRVDEEDRL